MGRDCEHGRLARSCPTCELEREIGLLVDQRNDLLDAAVAMLDTWGSDDEDAIIAARNMAHDAVDKAMGE